MAEAVNNNTTTAASSSAGVLTNPGSVLDKDAFLKLLLTELQYQDPTSPMETDKMLSQTADLTVVESQQNIASAITDMAAKFTASNSFNLVNTVGKIADTGYNAINVDGVNNYEFQLYFGDDYNSAEVVIMDQNGEEYRNFSIEAGNEGTMDFTWDGTDDNGNVVPSDSYVIKANYTTESGEYKTTVLGQYKVESVKFDGEGEAQLKLGDSYYTIDAIQELKEAI